MKVCDEQKQVARGGSVGTSVVCVSVCALRWGGGGGNTKPALPQHPQGRGPFFKLSLPTMQWALLLSRR